MYYDGDRNLEAFYDDLNHGWAANYDDRGNLEWVFETVVSGSQEWTYHWQYDGFNNVTHYTDPAGNTVELLTATEKQGSKVAGHAQNAKTPIRTPDN